MLAAGSFVSSGVCTLLSHGQGNASAVDSEAVRKKHLERADSKVEEFKKKEELRPNQPRLAG